MNKWKWLVAGAVVIVVIVLAIFSRYAYKEIQELNGANELLLQTVTEQLEWAQRFETAMIRLEQQDAERSQQLRKFENNLNYISAENEEIRAVLTVVVPPAALTGLQSYGKSTKRGSDSGS